MCRHDQLPTHPLCCNPAHHFVHLVTCVLLLATFPPTRFITPPACCTATVHDSADVPYDLSPEFVEELFTKHKIDYIIHGDDPCLLPDGTDAYAHAKKLGRFKMVRGLQMQARRTQVDSRVIALVLASSSQDADTALRLYLLPMLCKGCV